MACSIARTLDVIGEPWSPLVLRDVWAGVNRFDQLQADLGISRKVLTERIGSGGDEPSRCQSRDTSLLHG